MQRCFDRSSAFTFLTLGKKTAGKVVPSVNLMTTHLISQFYVLFISTVVGSVASMPTTYILIGIDFLINLHGAHNVWKKFKERDITACGEELMTLVLNEFLELIVPICYLFCYLAAWYGQNQGIIGKHVTRTRKVQ